MDWFPPTADWADDKSDIEQIKEQLEKLKEQLGARASSIVADITDTTKKEYVGIPVLAPFNGGLFWLTPKPDQPPYIKEGDQVEEGQIVCLIEISKMFNETPCPVTGTIQKILLDNGEIIKGEGQPLIIITPDDPEDPRIVTISVDGQINEEERKTKEAEEKLHIYSHLVGFIAGPQDHPKATLAKIGDIVQSGQPVAYVIVLQKAYAICYQGDKPVRVAEVFVKIQQFVEYGTPIVRLEYLAEETQDNLKPK